MNTLHIPALWWRPENPENKHFGRLETAHDEWLSPASITLITNPLLTGVLGFDLDSAIVRGHPRLLHGQRVDDFRGKLTVARLSHHEAHTAVGFLIEGAWLTSLTEPLWTEAVVESCLLARWVDQRAAYEQAFEFSSRPAKLIVKTTPVPTIKRDGRVSAKVSLSFTFQKPATLVEVLNEIACFESLVTLCHGQDFKFNAPVEISNSEHKLILHRPTRDEYRELNWAYAPVDLKMLAAPNFSYARFRNLFSREREVYGELSERLKSRGIVDQFDVTRAAALCEGAVRILESAGPDDAVMLDENSIKLWIRQHEKGYSRPANPGSSKKVGEANIDKKLSMAISLMPLALKEAALASMGLTTESDMKELRLAVHRITMIRDTAAHFLHSHVDGASPSSDNFFKGWASSKILAYFLIYWKSGLPTEIEAGMGIRFKDYVRWLTPSGAFTDFDV